MSLAAFTALDGLWVALSVFLVLVALGLLYFLVRLGGAVGRLGSFVRGLENEALPVINKSGGTIDRVNLQLDKVDLVTDSAVDAADSLDTAIRALTLAITRPVQKLSGVVVGVRYGTSVLKTQHDPRRAYEAGREAAVRREEEIAAELAGEGDRSRASGEGAEGR